MDVKKGEVAKNKENQELTTKTSNNGEYSFKDLEEYIKNIEKITAAFFSNFFNPSVLLKRLLTECMQ